MQRVINIFYGIGIVLVGLAVFLRPDEKQTETPGPINYELYEYRFKELENRIDTLSAQDIAQDTILSSIKFKIITDEKTIRNATNADVDSIFNAMVARQRKSGVH